MNGKDLLAGMSYVNSKYVEEAENSALSGNPSYHRLKRPLLIAAIVAMMLLLVGCAVVYVLKMESLKIGKTTDERYVFAEDGIHITGTETVNQDVLTLAGLEGSNGYQAALEWYEFRQAYDPDREIQASVWGNEPEFPAAYRQYILYTQEMKDALDAILEKYALKPLGALLDFRTTKYMCEALGIERIFTSDNGVTLQTDSGGAYENGNFWLNLDIKLPEEENVEVTKTSGILYWNRKDCFSSDLFTIDDTEDWQEWNYTTVSGRNVLIIRSDSDWRGWIICEREEALMALQIEARRDLGNNVDGKTWWDHYYMTDKQLELVADAIDFNIQPNPVNQSAVSNQPDIPASATQNGYTLTLKSVETDGYVARILVGVTAPEGTDIENLDIGTGSSHDEFTPASGQAWGSGAFNDIPDGDGLANTKDLLLVADLYLEDGSTPFAAGAAWNLHIVDLWVDRYLESERLLVEGEWLFPITFDETNSDYREIELLSEPIRAKACYGWGEDGTDALEEFTLTSFKLRKFSCGLQWDRIPNYHGVENFGDSADFFGYTDHTGYHSAYVVMKDGTEIDLPLYRAAIDLDQVAYVMLADGTMIPVPGVAVELPEETASVAPEAEGVELLSQPMDYNALAGYVTGPDGIDEPLYETFHLTSVTLSSSALTIKGTWAFDGPDTQMQVVMRDGSQVTLTGSAGAPYSEPMSVLAAQIPIDVSQAAYVLFPDGTKLDVPQ